MERLENLETYGPELALKIMKMGAIGIPIANRWMLGWPERVQALLSAGTYFEVLTAQWNKELDILAEEPNLRHMTNLEILRMHEVTEYPPAVDETV